MSVWCSAVQHTTRLALDKLMCLHNVVQCYAEVLVWGPEPV